MKQYIGISRDHSLSMSGLRRAALKDYNQTIDAIKNAANNNNIETIVSVVECGRPNNYVVGQAFDPMLLDSRRACVRRYLVNQPIALVFPLYDYPTDGRSTPLLDSVGELISIHEQVPDRYDPNVSFLEMIITDGEENSSQIWNVSRLTTKIAQLNATDKWTFVFRCPRGYAKNLTRLGIPAGNILEWDQTQQGVETATAITASSFDNYYVTRSTTGQTNTNKFFADLTVVPLVQIKQQLIDISSKVISWITCPAEDGLEIRKWFETKSFGKYFPGELYYQLTKTEKIQEGKKLIILDTNSNAMYTGNNVRSILGLPEHGQITLTLGKLGIYKVFVQSTSYTRKIVAATRILYYK